MTQRDSTAGDPRQSPDRRIAVIGMSCRFPGADGPDAYRRLLREASDAVTEPPPDRVTDAPRVDGAPLPGGFVDAHAFDPEPFGISPREAVSMDPRQRLMLELVWEAAEDARLPAEHLSENRTGVFVGAMGDDHAARSRAGGSAADHLTLTSTSRGVIANRVSYAMGLRGPSLAVDTGQSSSLVSVHLAMESLRRGESDLAAAGGVHLNLSAASAAGEEGFGALSRRGRCRTFDAAADGYARGEGGGAVLLKRLPEAVADGDRVHAVLLGGAVGNDGATAGLTVPGRRGQADVLRLACRDAGVAPAQVGYVELHGTGTRAGDPVEAAALGEVLGAVRSAGEPLPVGSVKTNIGHLGAAAGIAGLIKAVLGTGGAELVPSLGFESEPPEIPLAELGLAVQRTRAPWEAEPGSRIAGVSSFGMGGTNCHLLVAGHAAPAGAPNQGRRESAATGDFGESAARGSARDPEPAQLPFVLSAAGDAALRAQAGRLRERVAADTGADLYDLGASLAATRSALGRRAAVVAANRADLLEGLAAVEAGARAPGVLRGRPRRGATAVLFPGQGTQYARMGRRLYERSAVFAAAFDEVCAVLDPLLPRPLHHVLWALEDSPRAALLERTGWTQPALFSVGVALYRLVESWGVRPALAAGHSVGEIAAAHVCGMLDLSDACALVAVRARRLDALPEGGAMFAVRAGAAEAAALIEAERASGQVAVAALNGPESVVLSGAEDTAARITRLLGERGRRTRRLHVSHAFHSPLVDPALPGLREAARRVRVLPGDGPALVSGVTGAVAGHDELADPEYWVRQAREAVRFADCLEVLHERGAEVYCELGPGGALSALAREAAEARGGAAPALVTGLRREEEERAAGAYAAGLHVNGVVLDTAAVFGPGAGGVDLPTYAFQRRRFGPDPERSANGAAGDPRAHSYAGEAVGADGPVRQESAPHEEGPRRTRLLPNPGGPAGERRLRELVLSHTAAVLGHSSPAAVDSAVSFRDMGFDSTLAVELRDRMSEETGLALPATLLFDAPTPEELLARLCAELGSAEPEAGPAAVATPRPRASAGADEPVAITGIGCRFPGGVDSPEALWELAATGGDATSEFPTDRGWDVERLYDPHPGVAGRTYVRRGGFLHAAAAFDAGFFGISPREALAMDPQQRVLLETAWEAVERSGLRPADLRGARVGVFAGASHQDYGPRMHEPFGDTAGCEGHLLTGQTQGVVSGRISYVFGFAGPTVTVDTACSSSLVAVHQAVQALRRGECDLALAGGVAVMAAPGMFTEFGAQQGLAPDGRCKPYSAAADGTAWSEGAGMVLLERLSDAVAAGRCVWGVLRGSAVNSDGASNGLSAPNGAAQEAVVRAALADGGVEPAQVGVVEGHGTGTVLGDPIEVGALGRAFGGDGGGVLLGSVKANIAHTQAAAGVAGLVSLVGVLGRGIVPPLAGASDGVSELIGWEDSGVGVVAGGAVPWPGGGERRVGGVSSFGISGTNAHVVVEEPPPGRAYDFAALRSVEGLGTGRVLGGVPEPGTVPQGDATDGPTAEAAERRPDGGELSETTDMPEVPFESGLIPWVVSGAVPGAVRDQAVRLRAAVWADPAKRPSDVGHALATTRTCFEHRAVVLAREPDDFLGGLAAVARGRVQAPGARLVQGSADLPPGPVLVFGGQGSQWPGMGAGLLASSRVFRARIDECERALAPYLDWSPSAVLRGGAAAPGLERADIVQPVLWAVMVSLAEVWRSVGVRPAAVVGHSQGEIAAACVAGALSLEDAAAVVALRSRAVADLVPGGAMASLGEPAECTAQRTAVREGRVHVAAHNGPNATAVAGDAEAVAGLVASAADEGVRARAIDVDYASHTPYVEAARSRITEELGSVVPRSGDVPFFSTVTGTEVDGTALDSDYWYRNLREPVRFGPAVQALAAAGHGLFIESAPHPVLSAAIEDTLAQDKAEGTAIGTLRRDDGGAQRMLVSVAEAFVRGAPVDWTALLPRKGARRVDLPTYPFQRRRYWLNTPRFTADPTRLGQAGADHPLLGAAVDLADGRTVCTGRLAVSERPWLADHAVGGRILLAGSALADLVVGAGGRTGCPELAELVLEEPLVLPEAETGGAVDLQVALSEPDGGGRRECAVYSRPADSGQDRPPWERHACATLGAEPQPGGGAGGDPSPADWPPPGAAAVDLSGAYDRLAERGYEYGPAFRGLTALWRRGTEVFAEVSLPEELRADADSFGLHPVLLDAALHAWLIAAPDLGAPRLPHVFAGLRLHASGATGLRVHLRPGGADDVSLALTDPAGAPVATLDRLVLRPVPRGPAPVIADLHTLEWPELTETPPARRERWAFVGPRPACGHAAADPPEGGTARELDVSPAQGRGDAPGATGTGADVGGLEYPDMAALRGDVAAGAETPGVVVAVCPEMPRHGPRHAAHLIARKMLEAAREWALDDAFSAGRLIVVTRNAVAAAGGDRLEGLAQAPVWGLLRSAQAEYPGRFVLVDDDGAAPLAPLLRRVAASGAPQAALRSGRVHTARVAQAPPQLPEPPGQEPPCHLDVTAPGSLDGLAWRPAADAAAPLPPGRVRIEVRAAGVNFRDVVVALGLLDGEHGMGIEGAGVVTEVGPGVDGLAVGDRVMGLFDAAFGEVAVADRQRIAPIPRGWTFERAAAVPVAYLTAYDGLVDLAGLRAGESVLVHAAAGGVGTAAVALARHLGAEVFATASPAKWPLLRAMGVDDAHLASSRTAGFGPAIRATPIGRDGVDVVLNALAGDLVDASLDLLAPGGRFLEMGKTDLRDPARVAAEHPGVTYLPFNLPDVPPERIQRMLTEVLALLEEDALGSPPPVRRRPLRDAPAALRDLQHGASVGKTVLAPPRRLDPDGTVLITGGTGTLGAAVARHLITAHGARRLLLTGRRGPMAPRTAELLDELTRLGADVEVRACDAADRAAVAGLISAVPDERPLTAVVHAAGVLEDATLAALTPAQLDRVLAAKVDGAWHLHELTEGADLAAFMLFSSAVGVLGGPGQAAYAAANTFLDSLAHHRAARGLPAASLSWGLWAERSGMTGHLGEAGFARMRRAGLEPMGTPQALGMLDSALALDRPHVIPARLRTAERSGAAARGRARLPRAARDAGAPSPAAAGPAPGPATVPGAGLPPEERHAALLELVREHAATVLGHSSPSALRPDRGLSETGIDSLTAVELRNRLGAATGLRLPATVLFDHPTPDALAAMLAAELAPSSGAEQPAEEEAAEDGSVRGELLRAVRGIPVSRLRESGVLEALRDLARGPASETATGAGSPEPGGSAEAAAIDGMSIDDLVDLALTDDDPSQAR